MATRLSLSLADYVVTEAGFGADLGAEKFLDIKCRAAGIAPSACVLVATVRALKSHGGVAKADLNQPNPDAVRAGLANLGRHIENMKDGFGLPVVGGGQTPSPPTPPRNRPSSAITAPRWASPAS